MSASFGSSSDSPDVHHRSVELPPSQINELTTMEQNGSSARGYSEVASGHVPFDATGRNSSSKRYLATFHQASNVNEDANKKRKRIEGSNDIGRMQKQKQHQGCGGTQLRNAFRLHYNLAKQTSIISSLMKISNSDFEGELPPIQLFSAKLEDESHMDASDKPTTNMR